MTTDKASPIEAAINNGMNVFVVALPEGDDPDSFIRREGADAMRARIAEAKPWHEELFSIAYDLALVAGGYERLRLYQQLVPVVRRIAHPVLKAHYTERLAAVGGVSVAEAARAVGGWQGPQTGNQPRNQPRGGFAL